MTAILFCIKATAFVLLLCSNTRGAAAAAKARVNVLFITSDYDWLMASASTYNGSANAGRPFKAGGAPNYSGEPWIGNAHLKNVDVYYITRDTLYTVAWNPLISVRILLGEYGVLATSTAAQKSTQIHMIAGPPYSGEAKGLAQITALFNTVMISGSATSPAMSDKQKYPTFFRTVPSDGDLPLVAVGKFREMGYDRVTTLCFSDDFVLDFVQMLGVALQANNMIEENRFILYDNTNGQNRAHPNWLQYFTDGANGVKNANSHVWLAFIGAQAYQNYQLLCALYKAGVMGDKYQGFLFGTPTDEHDWWYNGVVNDLLYNKSCTRANIEQVLRGVIIVVKSAAFDQTPADYIQLSSDKFRAGMLAEMHRSKRPINAGGFRTFSYYVMDSITACALALDYAQGKLLTHNQTTLDVKNAPAARTFTYTAANDSLLFQYATEYLASASFHGLTGKVSFNMTTGDRVARLYTAHQFQQLGDKTLTRIAKITATDAGIDIEPDQPAVYPTADGKPPPQSTKPSAVLAISVGVAGGIVLLIGLVLAIFLVRRHLRRVALKAAIASARNWIIDPHMLTICKSSGSTNSSNLLQSMVSVTSSGIRNTVDGIVRPYTTFNHLENRVNAYVLRRKAELSLDEKIVKQMMTVQACASDNTSRFVGICPMLTRKFADRTMHCIMAGSSKGSLSDFLAAHRANNEDGGFLDEVFSFSLIRDLHKGLTDIHRVTRFHGRLSSTVCMVDNRMSLRISDYGFSPYRMPAFYDTVANVDHEIWLWCAPEVLRQFIPTKLSLPQSTSPPNLMAAEWALADVYSYGVICSEMFTVNRPFAAVIEAETADSSTITEFLRRFGNEPHRPSNMVRSALWSAFRDDKLKLAADIFYMILKCVAGEPTARPSLSDIGHSLRAMVKTRKLSSNITEMLMQQLEAYAKNLEGIVAQRTEALAVEQDKLTTLLYQILPPSVADALKNGEVVPPKEYDSVTVCFSDVVDFTTLSSASTPIQIVDFLNDLYNAFDRILSTCDVYKVETIGDAYMVVSGLPKLNGHQHVRNIARMSLALIEHVTTKFRVRHRPDEQLRLRIGMHTGPCAAGVVGFVMPRYCLFGDTVNTASRMESTGEALRIHASEASARALVELGACSAGVLANDENATNEEANGIIEFRLVPRGTVDVKGKSHLRTFWLDKNVSCSRKPPFSNLSVQ